MRCGRNGEVPVGWSLRAQRVKHSGGLPEQVLATAAVGNRSGRTTVMRYCWQCAATLHSGVALHSSTADAKRNLRRELGQTSAGGGSSAGSGRQFRGRRYRRGLERTDLFAGTGKDSRAGLANLLRTARAVLRRGRLHPLHEDAGRGLPASLIRGAGGSRTAKQRAWPQRVPPHPDDQKTDLLRGRADSRVREARVIFISLIQISWIISLRLFL